MVHPKVASMVAQHSSQVLSPHLAKEKATIKSIQHCATHFGVGDN